METYVLIKGIFDMVDYKRFGNIGKFKIYRPGDVLFLQNALGDCMYIIVKGTFGVYINSFTDFPTKVADIPAGAFLGEMAVIDGSPRSATIVSEEQGMAIAVEKEHFKTLLADNPDIAAKILKTLSERAVSTTNLAREKGNTVEDLPPELQNPVQNPDTDFDTMLYLAGRIRELNELLNPKKEVKEIEIKQTVKMSILLPGSHERLKHIDKFDNKKLLSNSDCVCPYCGNGFKGRVPMFARLEEKEKTRDFRITHRNMNVLFYTNIICPNCNYCDSYQEFLKEPTPNRTPKVTGNQFINKEDFTGYSAEFTHTLDEALLSYYLNIQCLKQVPDSQLRAGKAWQRLYWLYTDYNEQKWANYAAKEAYNQFKIYIDINGDTLVTEDYMTINIIMGELCVFLNRKEDAMTHFEKNTNISGYAAHDLTKKSIQRFRELKE
jgi:uncharacterized protein (DUF2225 family)